MIINFIDKGIQDYGVMLENQRSIFSDMVNLKKKGATLENEYVFLVEHNPVVTLGKHAKKENVLLSENMLKSRGISVYNIERGGDVTYHGPGQLVVYPLIDLEFHKLGVKDYVNLLEEAVIKTISEYSINGTRVAGASGVWIAPFTNQERKICALGVKCSRYITMHGLALNVNIDLDGFNIINPCGFVDKGVTSMAKEIGTELDMSEVKERISFHLKTLLGTECKAPSL